MVQPFRRGLNRKNKNICQTKKIKIKTGVKNKKGVKQKKEKKAPDIKNECQTEKNNKKNTLESMSLGRLRPLSRVRLARVSHMQHASCVMSLACVVLLACCRRHTRECCVRVSCASPSPPFVRWRLLLVAPLKIVGRRKGTDSRAHHNAYLGKRAIEASRGAACALKPRFCKIIIVWVSL